MFVDHVLDSIRFVVGVIAKDRVMNRSRCSLKGDVRIEIEIPLERCRHITLDQTARQWITLWIVAARPWSQICVSEEPVFIGMVRAYQEKSECGVAWLR